MITLIPTHACSNCNAVLKPGSDEWDRHQRVYANNSRLAAQYRARVEDMQGKQFRFTVGDHTPEADRVVTLVDFRVESDSLCSMYGPLVRAVFDKPLWGPHYTLTEALTSDLYHARLGDDGVYTVEMEDF